MASCPQHAVEADRLLELAGEAMYRANAAGAPRVAVGAALTDDAGSRDGVSSGA